MAQPINPFALKTATALFTLLDGGEAEDFSSHIDTVLFNPSSSAETWTAIDSYSIGENSPETWSLELGLVQDLDQSGLLRFLMEHTGEKATLDVTLKRNAQPIKIVVTLASPSIGGTSDGSIARSTLTLQCDGRPEWQPIAGA